MIYLQLKLICIVRKFDVTSTTVTYQLEDHTGRINGVLWLEHDQVRYLKINCQNNNNLYCRLLLRKFR